MQGFEQMLKMIGLDPVKLKTQAEEMISSFNADQDKRFQALHDALMAKLDSMDAAIKKLDPDYVPDNFAELTVVGEADPVHVVNPDHPDGGPVDPETLDPEKLAAMEPVTGAEIRARRAKADMGQANVGDLEQGGVNSDGEGVG